jgi:NADH-ubiquinone oxidoreductase chain 5
MEGPTPVSALLHAATMVTAGVFLVIRCSFLFEYSENILLLICLFGGLTCFFSGLVGCLVFDVKKIIAYSTCSQLGYMFFSCGLSKYDASIFHLFNHAFFKALLFLSAGSLIHSLYDEQDVRKMGSLVNFLPFTYFCFLLGSFVIMGFPFLTAFYSKDMILEFAYSRYIIDSDFIYLLGIVSAFSTCFYSLRLLFFVFFNDYNGFFVFVKENDFFIFLPMFLLSFCAIFMGFVFNDIFLGLGTPFFGNSIFVIVLHYCFLDSQIISPFLKNLPIIFFFCGLF